MSKKDKETRGPFTIMVGGHEFEIYTTNGVVDFSLSSKELADAPWNQIQDSISAKMKTLAITATEFSKSISQLGTALRSGDPRIK